MNRVDDSTEQDAIRAFADVVRQLPGPMSARQRSLGWQRLQQAATRAPVFNETKSLGWRVW